MYLNKVLIFCAAAICIFYSSSALGNEESHALGDRIEPSELESWKQNRDELLSRTPQGDFEDVKGPRRIYLYDAELFRVYSEYTGYMMKLPLDARHRELAILVIAREWDARYEWWAHESGARKAGISDAVIEDIRAKRTPVFDTSDEQIIYDYTREIVTLHRVSDETYKKAWDLLGTDKLIKLTWFIGHYCSVAVALNAHEIALPEGEKNPF